MASIPLPALDIKPPQQGPGPMEMMAQMMQLRGMQGQQQLQQAQLTGVGQENQQRALMLQDQQVLRESAKGLDWTKPDTFDKWLTNAQQQGVSPQTLSQMQLQRAKLQEQLATTDKATLAAESERNSQLAGHLDAIKKETDPQQRAAVATQQAQAILDGGLAKDPQSVQRITAMAKGQYVPTNDELDSYITGLLDHKTQVDLALKKSQTDAANADLPGKRAKSYQDQLSLVGQTLGSAQSPDDWMRRRAFLQQSGIDPAILSQIPQRFSPQAAQQARALGISPQEAASMPVDRLSMQDWLAKHPGKGPAEYERYMKTLVPQFNFNLQTSAGGLIPGSSGGAGATPGSPATNGVTGAAPAGSKITDVPALLRGRVQAVLDYRVPAPPQGRNNPVNNAVNYWVNQVDPNYDQTEFPARNKLIQAMTSGGPSKQINAINTAMGHVGVLGQAIDALRNGNMPALNRIANSLGVQTGSSAVTTFNTIVHRVGPELASAYIQGGGGEGERGTTAADFDAALGPDQLKSNVAITAKLLRSKIGALENQYKQTMRRDDFQQRFITPEAQATLDRLSPQGGAGGFDWNAHPIVHSAR